MLARPKDLGLTQVKPFHGGIVEHDYPSALGTDMHQAFELGVLLSGRVDRHYEDLVIGVKPGEVWLCAAWEPHGWRATAPQAQELVLQFLPEFLGDEMFDNLSWLSLFSAPPAQRPRVTKPEMRKQMLAIADELRKEMRERGQGWLAAVRLAILRLLLAISREWKPGNQAEYRGPVRPGNLARVMPAVRLVYSRPARRLSLEEAATACGLSVTQFAYIFRQTMGLSFGKFSLRARLAYVGQLLLSTDLPVEAVAEVAGFSDGSHLHHAFARAYGCTPAHYRTDGRCMPNHGSTYTVVEETPNEQAELRS